MQDTDHGLTNIGEPILRSGNIVRSEAMLMHMLCKMAGIIPDEWPFKARVHRGSEEDAVDWCKANLGAMDIGWTVAGSFFFFKDQGHHTMFILTWG